LLHEGFRVSLVAPETGSACPSEIPANSPPDIRQIIEILSVIGLLPLRCSDPIRGSRLSVFYAQLAGQDNRSIFGDCDGMLEVCAVAAVNRDRGPTVLKNLDLGAAGVDHRFNRQNHTGL